MVLLSFRVLVLAGLLATCLSTLSVYPHQLAYFNEAAGGPHNGHRHLLQSNFDWGQAYLAVNRWLDANTDRGVSTYACLGDYSPGYIRRTDCPCSALLPGNYVVSANMLFAPARDRLPCINTLRSQKPTARIGYCIYVYRIANDKLEDKGNPPATPKGLLP